MNAESLVQREELCRQIAWHNPKLRLYAEWPECHVFAQDHGIRSPTQGTGASVTGSPGPVLIGRAFRRGDHGTCLRTGAISVDGSEYSPRFSSRQFTCDFWGDFVLFNRVEGGVEVTRDAKGAIPCFYLELDQCIIWFSDVSALPLSIISTLKVDPSFFRLSLFFPKMTKVKTGLKGVNSALPGYSYLSARDGITASSNWSPKDAATEPYPDLQTAIQEVRRSVIEVVSAYLDYYENPIISVGGLDSSIIWCIAHHLTGHNPQGVSLYSDAGRGDERPYVSELPNNGQMAKIRMCGGNVDVERLFSPRLMVSPPGFVDLIDLAWDHPLSDLAPDCDAMMFGVGGDNVFLQAADIYPALDYVGTYGFGANALRHIVDSARHEQTSVLNVIKQCLRQSVAKRDNWSHYVSLIHDAMDHSGLAEAYLSDIPGIGEVHPGYRDVEGVASGKALQILTSCFYASDFYDPYSASGVERCETFLSQPILEACLKTPSWFLAHQGIDRGLARLAFADILPAKVLRRTSKGTPEDVYDQFFALHHARMCKFLDDGVLMNHGVITKSSLKATMDGDLISDKRRSHQIISLVSYEAWARQWS
jgi:asparagine synthase (glutamine-hydrolysing)